MDLSEDEIADLKQQARRRKQRGSQKRSVHCCQLLSSTVHTSVPSKALARVAPVGGRLQCQPAMDAMIECMPIVAELWAYVRVCARLFCTGGRYAARKRAEAKVAKTGSSIKKEKSAVAKTGSSIKKEKSASKFARSKKRSSEKKLPPVQPQQAHSN